jgi:hypothetical protein
MNTVLDAKGCDGCGHQVAWHDRGCAGDMMACSCVREFEPPRYTLAQARQILAEQECHHDGHDLEQVRGDGLRIVRLICGRCGVTFVPKEAA